MTLQEKVKFLDYAEANEKLSCGKLADVFKIGKTAANNILKNNQMLREQYEHFHVKTKKRSLPGNIGLSMISYMSGTKNAAPQIFILMALY